MNKKRAKAPAPTSPHDRLRTLELNRRHKMARSAHAYVRGNTHKFYEWLRAGCGSDIPPGPPVWICGDCHLGNLGPVANASGKVEIEIRDLDQTVIGNPAHDLVRLGLSLATAARGSDLPGVTTARMLEHMLIGYEAGLAPSAHKKNVPASEVRPIDRIMQQAVRRRWRHLAEERIEDVSPTIPLGRRFWALTPAERTAIDTLFETTEAVALVTNLRPSAIEKGDKAAKVRVLDAAYWMKGCSSLGRLRFAVLLRVGGKNDFHYSLIDIKEAVDAAAPAAKHTKQPKDFAQRVVTGACALSPFLGQRMLAAKLLGKPVVLRELMPQDLKLEIDRLTRDEAVAAAQIPRPGRRQGPRPSDGRGHPPLLACRVEAWAFKKLRCPFLAVDRCGRSRRQPRGRLPGTLPPVRRGLNFSGRKPLLPRYFLPHNTSAGCAGLGATVE